MIHENDPARAGKHELITFSVGQQDFCMDIMLVREIRGWTNVTVLPHSPADVLGVMNLRGAVVPIVDLSARLGLGACRPEARNVIIIALIGRQTVGFLVTAVSDIVSAAPEDIQPLPQVGGTAAGNYVKGIIASRHQTLRVLNIDMLAAAITEESEVA
ncbi:chemotaxis protein CheW [Oceaniglobus roseus]|uniref:chemotaxis protein CheW n=1 Tax=Oceaniglobus roseus TaxID=1737570 RepID=UPI000C7EAE9B|nr:chemotaxis protein CheW [Kandeliimicrobium roseum]